MSEHHASPFRFVVDSDSLMLCREILESLVSSYEIDRAIAIEMMNEYWRGADLRNDPYFGNRLPHHWASIVHQNHLRLKGPSDREIDILPGVKMSVAINTLSFLLGTQAPKATTFLAPYGFEEALRLRESSVFERQWSEALAVLRRGGRYVEEEFDDIQDEVLRAATRSTGSAEVAGYVSDDVWILLHGIHADSRDPWLNALYSTYAELRFPTGELIPVEGSLREIVAMRISNRNLSD